MLPDRVSNPGPRTYETGALPIALRGPASPLLNFSPYRDKTVVFPRGKCTKSFCKLPLN